MEPIQARSSMTAHKCFTIEESILPSFLSIMTSFFPFHCFPDIEFLSPAENLAFQRYTKQLIDFAQSQPPFVCEGNCKAPHGTYLGAPWIQEGSKKARKGESVSITCQVWTRFNSKSLKGTK